MKTTVTVTCDQCECTGGRWSAAYQGFVRSKACFSCKKPHVTRNGKKEYACRSLTFYEAGVKKTRKLYLHVEIKKRTGIPPPTPLHRIVDHSDGNEFNCRRSNLVWATPRQNRANLFGQELLQVCLEV